MINKENIIKQINNWFKNYNGGGLITPDGWFGRPYDNIHMLTCLIVRSTKVILELDEQLLLTFTDLKSISDKGTELIFENYSQCVFDWQEYGNVKSHVSVYKSGIVKIVAPPG